MSLVKMLDLAQAGGNIIATIHEAITTKKQYHDQKGGLDERINESQSVY